MAARESQGLQVALILFVMVTVVLAVTTYVYFRKSEEMIKERDQQRSEAAKATEVSRSAIFKIEALKHMMGFERKPQTEFDQIKASIGGDAAMVEIFKRFDEDMKMYGQGLPDVDLCYINLPKNLITKIREQNSQITENNKTNKDLTDERDTVRVAEENRTKTAVTGLETAQTELVGERTKFNDERSRITGEKDKFAVDMETQRKELTRVTTKAQTDVEVLQNQVTQLAQQNENFRAKELAKKETSNEQPDGKISFVNQRTNSVWIDLGSADGLQQQMSFSVYDQDEIGVDGGKVKGKVEVIRIMESHLAEARIIEDVLSDPILPGDLIASTTFRKGQQTRFALTGFMDIDGDGKSDLAKLKTIIKTNGGLVDAELLEDGTVQGKITTSTRYLVQGEKPTDSSHKELMKGHTDLIDDSGKLGIEIKPLERLLDEMGYSRRQQVVPLTGGGGSGGASDSKSGSSGSQFRPRTAPKSAY